MMPRGIIYILVATLAFAGMNVLAKYLSGFHPMQVVFFRAAGTFVLIFPYMLYRNIPVLGTHQRLLFFRSLMGLLSLSAFFVAIQRIPLGSAISIRYIGPIFGAVLAFFYLKEKIAPLQWLSFLVAFAGVLVLKGFDVRIDLLSFMIVLFSALTVGVVFVLIRYLASREHHLTIINYFMVVSMLGGMLFYLHWRLPEAAEWPFVIGIGLTGMIGQIFMTKAFALEEAGVLAPFKYMELVYAMLLGFFIFGESYTFSAFMGIVLIVTGMLLNVYAKRRLEVS